jgi:hypothetical protein
VHAISEKPLRGLFCCLRHCERSEAIHFSTGTDWIASSLSLSSGAHSRDPLAPWRKRFAFVAGNDGIIADCFLRAARPK